jgi:long-chain acyl-CoA synthetase
MNDVGVLRHRREQRRLWQAGELGMGDYFWRAAEAFPADTCLIPGRPFSTPWGERVVSPTLRDWTRMAARVARGYCGLGVRARDAVGVYGAFGARYFLHFLALSRLGAIPVLVNERMAVETAAAYLSRTGVRVIMTDATRRRSIEAGLGGGDHLIITEPDLATAPECDFAPYAFASNDPVLITHTSGTTGMPKAVMLEHGAYFYAMGQSLLGPRDPAVRRAVCALPPAHNAAIGAIAIAVVNGEELVLMPDQDGGAAIKAISGFQASCLVAFPQTFVDILIEDPEPAALESMELCVNLGDTAHEAHIRRLMKYGSHVGKDGRAAGSRFVDGLGSSEMGSMLFSKLHRPGESSFARCVGPPADWVEAAILDEDGTPLTDGCPGLLGVRSLGTFSGYWKTPTLTRESRVGGYFLTGDIAMRNAAGEFFHLDRATDRVLTDDGPIHTLVIEDAIMNACKEILDCSVIAIETEPAHAHVLCLAAPRDPASAVLEKIAEEIDRALRAAALPRVDEVRLVERREVPVGITGKVLKARIREDLQRARKGTATVSGHWTGGFSGTGRIEIAGHYLPLGVPALMGGSGAGVSPSSVLVAAAAGCYLLTLVASFERAGLAVERVAIESEGDFSGLSPPVLRALLHRPHVVLAPEAARGASDVESHFDVARRYCPTARAMPGVHVRVVGTVASAATLEANRPGVTV